MTATVVVPEQGGPAAASSACWLLVGVPAAVLVVAGVPEAGVAAWAVPVVWASVVDACRSRLPDRLVLPGIAVVVLLALTSSAVDGSGRLRETAVGMAVLAAPLALMHLLSPAGLGFGDVKFGVLLGAGIGYAGRPGAGLLVLVSAGLLQLIVVWARPWPVQRHQGAVRGAAPFGPSLAAAAVGWVMLVFATGGV